MKKLTLMLIVSILLTQMTFSMGYTADIPETKTVFFGTSAGSGLYPVNVAICEAMSRHPKIRVACQAVGSASKTAEMMAKGESLISQATPDHLARGYYGLVEYEGKPIFKDLRWAFPLAELGMNMLVIKDINSWEDLNGKPVGVLRGSGGQLTQFLLDANGIVPSKIWESLETEMIIERMRTKSVVCYLGKGGLPDSMITRIFIEVPGVHFLPIKKEMIDKMALKYPGQMFPDVMQANTYPNQRKDIPTMSYGSGVGAHKNMPTEVMYEAVKLIYEDREKIASLYASAYVFKDWGKYILKWATIPLHPGIIKFLREDLKMTVPDKVVPPEGK